MRIKLLFGIVLFFGLTVIAEGLTLPVVEDVNDNCLDGSIEEGYSTDIVIDGIDSDLKWIYRQVDQQRSRMYHPCEWNTGTQWGKYNHITLKTGYLKFNISALKHMYTRPIELAKLRLYIKDITKSGGLSFYNISDKEWNEKTFTYSQGVSQRPGSEPIAYIKLNKDEDKGEFIFIDITDELKAAIEKEHDHFSLYLRPTITQRNEHSELQVIFDSKDGDISSVEKYLNSIIKQRPAQIDIRFDGRVKGLKGERGNTGGVGSTGDENFVTGGQGSQNFVTGPQGATSLEKGPQGKNNYIPGKIGERGSNGPSGARGIMGPPGRIDWNEACKEKEEIYVSYTKEEWWIDENPKAEVPLRVYCKKIKKKK